MIEKRDALPRRRWLFYALLGFLLLLLERTLYTVGDTVPQLLPPLVVAVAIWEGPVAGGVFGLLWGLVSDAAGSAPIYLSPLTFLLYGFFCALLAERYFKPRFSLFAACHGVVCILHVLLQTVLSVATAGTPVSRIGITYILWRTLAAIVVTFLSGVFVYPAVRLAGAGRSTP